LDQAWHAHTHRDPQTPEPELGADDAMRLVTSVFQEPTITNAEIARLLAPVNWELAFGAEGEAGNPVRIRHLAEELMELYGGFLNLSVLVRNASVPAQFLRVFELAVSFAGAPVDQMREFVNRVVAEFDGLPAALREGTPRNVTLDLTITADHELIVESQHELELLEAELRSTAVEPRRDPVRADPQRGHHPFGAMLERRQAKQYAARLDQWQQERNDLAAAVELVGSFSGTGSDRLILKSGEAVFASITGASLIEDRAGGGHWEGRSSGVSIPIGSIGGRSIRYRTGSSRGHYVQSPPVATAVDTGTLLVTNRRVIYDWFYLRLRLALAHYGGTVAALVGEVQAQLAALDARKPLPSAPR
jgi:hypothetical protein